MSDGGKRDREETISDQVEILQTLNGELIKVARLQAITVGALFTGISIGAGNALALGALWPPNNIVDWLGLFPLGLAVIIWISEAPKATPNYSKIKLGHNEDLNECIEENTETINDVEQQIRTLHRRFAVAVGLFLIWVAVVAAS